ncbi:helix-turn-helix domain-containing protein [Haloactinomyces albus]|uniref:Transcriptional regulator with XRE-family HTH domain n=1 Tax=Haloactinomyces albus TaxID=1352928 RepID=A0AAE4CKC1_9ACTN|nr:helix-turn-helix transcriptional regulator [Haloactinomyces albus]MDR7301000.1 transcriptional regulator with XRE-family HTH domain [Haloactinomyces albus]
MASNTRTPKARALGSALREAREEQGLGLRQLASELGKNAGQLSRWENGERAPRPTDVAQILTHLGVNGERYEEIIAICSGTDEPRWLAVTLPEQRQQLGALLEFERAATTITEVSPLLIPGLLQTSDYARAIMSAGGVPANDVETRIAVRLGRRDVILRRDPAQLVALVGEAALRQVIGAPEVMVEQLEYLGEMAELTNVDLRVLPFSSGWHPALEGLFLLIESEQTPVVQLESRRSGLFLHEPEDVQTYREAADTVRQAAMSPEDSSAFIAEIAKDMEAAP